MSSQMKVIAIIGAVLVVGALGFRFLVADKPPAPQAPRGFHPN